MLSSSCNLQVTKVVPVAQAQPTSAGAASFSHYTAHLKKCGMLSSSCNLQVTKVVPAAQAQPTSAGAAFFISTPSI